MTRRAPSPVRVVLYGLGEIGRATARRLLALPGWRIVAAVDTDPAKAGRSLAFLLRRGARGAGRILVSDDPARALSRSRADVVIHTTGSRLKEVAPQIRGIAEAGLPCVSSCEEMALPEHADAAAARRIDRAARKGKVAVVGAGVNPGFVLDVLALALSGTAVGVTRVEGRRVLDPLMRRRAFRRKVGLETTRGEAAARLASGALGHVGLDQSALLVARGMGWRITRLVERSRVLSSPDGRGSPSRVLGLHQRLVAFQGRTRRVVLDMTVKAGVEDPHDAILLQGTPAVRVVIPGGLPGDPATVACLIRGAERILAPPRHGLLTQLELPLRPARRLAG